MKDYNLEKVQTPEEKAFQDEANQIFSEISEVLGKHAEWELKPVLQTGPQGILPTISLEKKPVKSDIVVPDTKIITP